LQAPSLESIELLPIYCWHFEAHNP